MASAGQSRGSRRAVAGRRVGLGRRGDLDGGSIWTRPEACKRARGLGGVVAQRKQIGLLPGVPMRYPPRVDHDDTTTRPLPAGWLDAMDESDAQLAAGQTVPLEPVLERMRDSIKRTEARRAAQDAEAAGQA